MGYGRVAVEGVGGEGCGGPGGGPEGGWGWGVCFWGGRGERMCGGQEECSREESDGFHGEVEWSGVELVGGTVFAVNR